MDPDNVGLLGWLGAILGGVLGLLGGVLGAYSSLRNAKGPRERALVIRAAAAIGLLVVALLVGLAILPGVSKVLIWGPYLVLLLVGIGWFNRTQRRIRQEEAGPDRPIEPPVSG